jgi:hypothetical protein
MSKGFLKFDLSDEWEGLAHRRAINADRVYESINDVGNEIFRPARKHGYGGSELMNLVNKCIEKAKEQGCNIEDEDGYESDVVSVAIAALEQEFYKILEKNGVDMSDYR